jgi:hypothetical protein
MPHRLSIENGSPNNDVLTYGMARHIACQLTLQNNHFCSVLAATVRKQEQSSRVVLINL